MFESVEDVGDADASAATCADALRGSLREARLAAARRMARTARWADLHAPAPGGPGVHPGADGTPAVTPFTATELGCLLGTTTASARLLLADTLDLRHRHPRLWAAVMTGQTEDYKAREVARATRAAGLTAAQARQVDEATVQAVVGLAWARAMTVLEAAIITADPAGHRRRRAEAEHERYVATSRRDTTTGLRTLIARTTAGDVARFEAMISHLAQLLRRHGDSDPIQLRRTKAFALLADPAAACLLLARPTTPERAPESDPTPAPDQAADSAPTPAPGPTPDTDPGSSPDADPEPEHVSAVDAASELGRLLAAQGATALARLRPRTVVYLHLSEEALRARSGVARIEGDIGPLEVSELHHLFGRDTLIVKPVLDPRRQIPVDSYEIPRSMREAMTLARPFEIFPYGTTATRDADLDHTTPYRDPDHGGPPGQTRISNLGPLSRGHHNAKTHGGFTLHQPLPGTYLWHTPAGHWYQVDHRGTRPLGRDTPTLLRLSTVEIELAGHLANQWR